MKNWKTTIGGSLSALGSALMAVGIVPQLNGAPSKLLTYIALAGFICNAIGAFLAHLWAADAVALASLTAVVATNADAQRYGDTTMVTKPAAADTAVLQNSATTPAAFPTAPKP